MDAILMGIHAVLHIDVILAIIFGVAMGVTLGSIPGLTAAMGITVIIPISYTFDPVLAMSMLVGAYKGGVYAGSVSGTLINAPGTPAAVATLLPGHGMAKKGQAKKALKIDIYASVFGDFFGSIILVSVAAQIAKVALKLGPPEFAALILLSLIIIAAVTGKNPLKGWISAFLGLLLGTVGLDPLMNIPRFCFGSINLYEGFDLVAMLIGLFAIAEIFLQIEKGILTGEKAQAPYLPRTGDPRDERISWQELKSCLPTFLRSSIIGTIIGAVPGIGSSVAGFIGYGMAKRATKNPKEFETGNIEGVAGAEAANNAVVGGALIPMVTLGIPGDVVTAILLGGFMIHGLSPGPMIFIDSGPVIYGIFASLFISNVFLFLLAFPTIKIWAKVAQVSIQLLFPAVIILCALGTYAFNNNIFDVKVMLFFGLLGYFMSKFGYPPAPMVIAVILGPLLEGGLRKALIMSDGSYFIFLQRPISLAFLILMALIAIGFFIKKSIKQ